MEFLTYREPRKERWRFKHGAPKVGFVWLCYIKGAVIVIGHMAGLFSKHVYRL